MSILTIENIQKTYFGKKVLDGLSLSLDFGDRLALTGENGSGKSTLLKIISGLETPDRGLVQLASGTVTGYLPQRLELEPDPDTNCLTHPAYDETVKLMRELEQKMATNPERLSQLSTEYSYAVAEFEALGGYSFRPKLLEALNGLGLSTDVVNRPLISLSGGERMRSALAHIIIRRPDFLLLDEPTNHLDIDGIEWLEAWLKSFSGTVIVISHDRSFLDNIATHTALIAGGKLTKRNGNYSHFKKVEEATLFSRTRELKSLKQALDHEREVAQTMLSHRKMNQYHSRERKADKLEKQIEEIESGLVQHRTTATFTFRGASEIKTGRELILEAEDISLSYGSKTLFTAFKGRIMADDRVLICGPNGCGKSSLLNIIGGDLEPSGGVISFNPRFKIGYMGQLLHFRAEDNTLIDEVRQEEPQLTEGQIRDLLARYGFRDIEVFKQVAVLSGGEKARLFLCKILLQRPDILFLDEPTNHLDITSREILERALLDFDGAILAVSHDRYFVDKIATKIWGFIGTEVREYSSYSSWRGMARADRGRELIDNNLINKSARREFIDDEGVAGQSGCKRDRAVVRRRSAAKRQRLGELETVIAELEQEIAELEASFTKESSPLIYENYAVLLQELDKSTTDYLELLEQLDRED
ncbi:MAG TPA: ABC-F family ATP-binding cassette domain-containing protein [Clostridiaceae bacterium]|nr:ABC-F family ATP-binding cassette domain-containing protein [Clostridiaceae bacterium]